MFSPPNPCRLEIHSHFHPGEGWTAEQAEERDSRLHSLSTRPTACFPSGLLLNSPSLSPPPLLCIDTWTLALRINGLGDSLVVQGLGLSASIAGVTGLIPGQETKITHAAQCDRKLKRIRGLVGGNLLFLDLAFSSLPSLPNFLLSFILRQSSTLYILHSWKFPENLRG